MDRLLFFQRAIIATCYCLSFVAPMCTEAVLVSIYAVHDDDIVIYTILTCSIIIHLILLIGGFRIMYLWALYCCAKNMDDAPKGLGDKTWSQPIYELKTFGSAAHIIYSMPLWIVTNIGCVWYWNDTLQFPWYIWLISHTVAVSYFIGCSIGISYVITKRVPKEDVEGGDMEETDETTTEQST